MEITLDSKDLFANISVNENNSTLPSTAITLYEVLTFMLGFVLANIIIIANCVTLIAIIKVEVLWEKYAVIVGSYCLADMLVGVTILYISATQLILETSTNFI